MQSVVLSGDQPLQKQILEIGTRYPGVMPSMIPTATSSKVEQ
jgi:hypothetical protein